MTTDITELAQREKFEAWFKSSFHPDKTGPYIKDQLYFAWKAASAELVEALESEKRICATWRKTAKSTVEKLEKAEKTSEARREAIDRTHNMFTRERDRANTAEEALEKAQKRISRLEPRSVKLPKAMIIEGGAYCSAHAHYDSDGDYYDRADVEEMLSAAGIKVEAE